MKKEKYLPLYKEWATVGVMPNDGMCDSIPGSTAVRTDKLLELFMPTPENEREFNRLACLYWGGEVTDISYYRSFNTFRQNVILFMAAMNGEL